MRDLDCCNCLVRYHLHHFEMSLRRENCKIPNCAVDQVKISQTRSIWCGATQFLTPQPFQKMKILVLLTVGSRWNF